MVVLRSHTKRGRERKKDRISELPEPLIHHIFSFLLIKSVVATSILSTKWRYLWTSIPTIDLYDLRVPYTHIGREKTNAFMTFVDRVLSFRLDAHSPSIKKFRLYFDACFDTSRVHGWISTVLRHKVEEIVLTAEFHSITFPPCLFTCESLTMLEINKAHLELPESVYFPKLKILRLRVQLKNDHSIPKLLSNSPVLEELCLQVCNYWQIQHLSIFGPKLKRLLINGLNYRNFNVRINAPNLLSFVYSSNLGKDFVLQNFPTLLDAAIILTPPANYKEKDELRSLADKLFASLSNMKRLTISDYSLKLLSYQDHFKTNVPSFNNLTHLELMSAGSYFGNGCYDTGNLTCRIVGTLLDFLHILPNLESLIFAEGFCHYEYYYWSLDLIPQCMLLHLKSIEFRGFYWYQSERDLISLFLKNAKVLQRVRITISDCSDIAKNSNYKKKVLDEIALFPRGSADCVLHVS